MLFFVWTNRKSAGKLRNNNDTNTNITTTTTTNNNNNNNDNNNDNNTNKWYMHNQESVLEHEIHTYFL